MAANEHDPLALEILKQRLENHRQYVSRQWQYYAAFILLNGLLINAAKDLSNTASPTVKTLAIAFVITSAVFFYLVCWTNMRIHRNAKKINDLAEQELIEIPRAYEGITFWVLFSITTFTLCWLIWLFSISPRVGLISSLFFSFIVVSSFLSTRKVRQAKLSSQ